MLDFGVWVMLEGRSGITRHAGQPFLLSCLPVSSAAATAMIRVMRSAVMICWFRYFVGLVDESDAFSIIDYMSVYAYSDFMQLVFCKMASRTKKTPPQVSEEALSLIAGWFRTLGEPSRLKILRALEEGEKNISELVAATGLTQANVSRHVQSLVDAGMVGRRREGLTVTCFISDPSITDLCDNVCNNLLKRLSQQMQTLGGA